MSLIQDVQNMKTDRLDLDEAVELLSGVNIALATYSAERLIAPQCLQEGVEILKAYIGTKRRENLKAALSRAEATEASLKTLPERREDVTREIQQLRAELEA